MQKERIRTCDHSNNEVRLNCIREVRDKYTEQLLLIGQNKIKEKQRTIRKYVMNEYNTATNNMFNFLRKLFYFELSTIFNCHHQEIVTMIQIRLYISIYKEEKRREKRIHY